MQLYMICFRSSPPQTQILIAGDRLQPHVITYKPTKLSARKKLHSSTLEITNNRPRNFNSIMAAKESNLMLTSGASGRVNALLSLRALKSLLLLVQGIVLILVFPFRARKRCISSSGGSVSTVLCSSSQEKGGKGKKGKSVPAVGTIVTWKTGSMMEVASRRAIAIRRVKQEAADCEGSSFREFSLFATLRGDTLFTQTWTPVSTKVRGLVVLLHGLNEHSGRYSDFAKQLNANGFKVYAMDWIGHGGSDGLHAYVHSLDDAVLDVKAFVEKVLGENPGLPCFFFGHSTGAAIVLKAVLDPKVETHVAGVVLTSPAVGVQPSHPVITVLAPIFSLFLPKYQFSAANKKEAQVSRDPEALVAKYSDPLVYTGSIRVRTGYEILRITSYLQQNMRRLTVPFLVLHGSADAVTDPGASQKLYEEASSADKSIKLLPELLHDLLFEPEREEITKDIIEWLNCRVQG